MPWILSNYYFKFHLCVGYVLVTYQKTIIRMLLDFENSLNILPFFITAHRGKAAPVVMISNTNFRYSFLIPYIDICYFIFHKNGVAYTAYHWKALLAFHWFLSFLKRSWMSQQQQQQQQQKWHHQWNRNYIYISNFAILSELCSYYNSSILCFTINNLIVLVM